MAYRNFAIVGIFALSSVACSTTGDVAPNETMEHEFRTMMASDVHLTSPILNGGTMNGGTMNGGTMNGGTMNGGTMNGGTMNGGTMNGVDLRNTAVAANAAGIDAQGLGLRGITLAGSAVASARANNGAVVSGTALVGATFSTETAEGVPVDVRFDAVDTYPTAHAGDAVHLYTISTARRGTDGWSPACGLKNGAPIRAIPLKGRWDYRQGVPGGGSKIKDGSMITFACEGYALAKCALLGYEPWIEVQGTSLDEHHQACVRMIRADYCGDGRTWTVDGTLINVYDGLKIQKDTESFHIESEWDAKGARCLSRRRIQGAGAPADRLGSASAGVTDHLGSASAGVNCAFERAADECAQPPEWGPGATLLVSEAP